MPKERISFTGSKDASADIVWKEVRAAQEQNAKLEKMLRTVEGEVSLKVNFDGPIQLLPISDTHLFAPESDSKKVDEILDKLDDENTYGIVCGDFIEGVNLHISDHMGKIGFTFGEQIWLARERLKPYVAKGKILAMVGWYNGHEGWAEKQSTVEALRFMSDGLIQPDGTKLKSVYNGGRLNITLSNGEKFSLKLFHDAGGGGSDSINPLGSQRNAAWAQPINSADRFDGVIAGHQHHRAATSKELTLNKLSGEVRSEVLLALGTVKGNDADHADKFLVSQAKGPTLPPGGTIVINQRHPDAAGDHIWATYGYERGGVLYEAAKIWDGAEKRRQTSDLLAQIQKREGKPTAEFDRRNSRTRTKEDEAKAPYFETFRWKITDGKLPIMIYLLQNARYGSSSGERDRGKLLDVYNQVVGDPFKYILAMRHYVDDDTAKDFDRQRILEKVANDLKGVRDTNSLLGFMLSSNLRTDRWSKKVVRKVEYYDRSAKEWKTRTEEEGALYPSDFLYKDSAIAGTPMYGNDSIMLVKFGSQEYSFQLLDHLSWSGSEFDMFRGLVQSRRKSRLSIDIVAGGHMPGAGTMVTPDGVLVSPGWFSDYDSRGKGNIRRAPMGGQSVILFPEDKMAIPAATFTEATDMHTALMLYAGLSKKEKEGLETRRK